MIHTIDKKIIEDRIDALNQDKIIALAQSDKMASLMIQDAINGRITELQSILSKIEELEVVSTAFAPDSVAEWIDDNNYIIVKNPNK